MDWIEIIRSFLCLKFETEILIKFKYNSNIIEKYISNNYMCIL